MQPDFYHKTDIIKNDYMHPGQINPLNLDYIANHLAETKNLSSILEENHIKR